MIEIEYTRMIAACVAAFLLSWGCYVTAYTKHKNDILDERNKRALANKTMGIKAPEDLIDSVKIEKSKTFFFGYRLALVGLFTVSAAIGWALGWAVAQDHILTWVEDAAVAAAGVVIGGLVLDKYIIHPIADGSFFEKVEDPIVQRFLQDGGSVIAVKEKTGFFAKRKQKKEAEKIAEAVDNTPPVIVTPEDANVVDVSHLTFDEKIRLLEQLKKSL